MSEPELDKSAMPQSAISAIIISFNEEATIGDCLESLRFCDEIVVVDSHSTDATRDIAAEFGARVILRDFNGFGEQKEFARQQARFPWILSLDADERITPVLQAEILSELQAPRYAAYLVPRLSYFLERPFYHSGWWPNLNLRLFRREAAVFNDKLVHEFAETGQPCGTLTNHMTHYTVRSLGQVFAKSQRYSLLGARQLIRQGAKVGFWSGPAHGTAVFLKLYILKRGFLDGAEGFVNACINFQTTYWKYTLAWMYRKTGRLPD